MRQITHGSTDQSSEIRVLNTDGTPATGLAFDTAGLVLSYRRSGAAAVPIALVTLASAAAAHADGGFVEIDATNLPGHYRIDLPDAACAAGATELTVGGKGTSLIVVPAKHPLVAFNPQDAVRLGLTALPNAAADAAGGLPVSDAGGLDLDTLLVRLDAAVSSRLAAAGYTAPDNAGIAAVQAKTDNLPADPADQSLIIAATDAIVALVNAVKAKTDSLPTDPADQSLIIAATDALAALLALVKAKTDNLPAAPAAVGDIPTAIQLRAEMDANSTKLAEILADTGTDGVVLSAAQIDAIVLALLKRDWTGITGEAARSMLNALRAVRNKVSITGGTMTVTKEDDATAAWTAAVTGTAGADPITAVDPA